jgi:hypothetical protein
MAAHCGSLVAKADHGTHLAANRFVPNPEEQVVTPLAGFDDVRK